jgi:hypothetical protein
MQIVNIDQLNCYYDYNNPNVYNQPTVIARLYMIRKSTTRVLAVPT